jgi:hypothetical protein
MLGLHAYPGAPMNALIPKVLAVLAAAALQAEAPRYGVQGLVNIPLADLRDYVDSKPGPGIGIHGTFDLGDGHMVRPRLDYTIYPEAAFATVKQTATQASLGADYLYFLSGRPEGLYLSGGVAAMRWSFETNAAGLRTSGHTIKLGFAAGVGYQWNATLGTEARIVHSAIASDFQADALQLGVTVRF